MFIDYFKKRKKKKTTIGECQMKKPFEDSKTMYFSYSSDVVFLDSENQMGIEFNEKRIRIDGVLTSDSKNFKQMMDAVVTLAKKLEYPQLFYADSLSDEMLAMFKIYGFEEKETFDPYNHYLHMNLDLKNNA